MGVTKNYIFEYSKDNFKKEKIIFLDFKGLNILAYTIYFIIMLETYTFIYNNIHSLININLYILSLATVFSELIIFNIFHNYLLKNTLLDKITRIFVECIFLNFIVLIILEKLLTIQFNNIITYIVLFVYIILMILILIIILNLLKLNLFIAIKRKIKK